jgi:hypothetical protein
VASTCPSSKAVGNFKTASIVGADFSNNSNITTYFFSSLTDESPVDGVPGLINYCVYPSPATMPTGIDPQAKGADGEPWLANQGSGGFSFGRPHGDPSNIPLDGTGTTMGTATWDTAPTDQTILLHINDPTVCHEIYGIDTPGTCFVKPSLAVSCNQGDTTVAYNALPFGVVNCPKSSEAFEAQSASEFGDEVSLKTGTSRTLKSLNVVFASYGCSVRGHWNLGDCVTNAGDTFTHPITANIYAVDDCGGTPCPGTLLATATQMQTIPYRPSADPSCPDLAQWFNPLAPGGGACQYSISTVLTL